MYVTTTRLSIIILAVALPMLLCIFLAARDILITLSNLRSSIDFHDLKQEAYFYWKWMALLSILSPIIANVMQVVLGLLNELSALAILGVGKTLSNMMLILVTSFKISMSPSFIKKTDAKSVSFALTDSIRYMLIISVFLAFLIHFISVPLVTTFYTEKYAESGFIFEILAYGIIFNLIFVGLRPVSTSIRRPSLALMADLINVVVVVVAAFFLIPRYSAVGAALALTCGLLVSTGSFALIVFRYLRYDFPWITLFKCLIAGSLALLPLQLIELSNIYYMGLKVCFGGILYIIILYIMKEIREEDLDLLKESVKIILDYLNIPYRRV